MNLLFAAGAVLLLLADLYTKKAAAAHLAGDPLVLIPGVLEAGAIGKTDGCAQAAALAEKI